MKPLLAVQGLTRMFSVGQGLFRPKRTFYAVKGVDLAVASGEVLGIVGESGCGKSTLARMMLGLLPPSSGSVEIEGFDIRTLDRRAVTRRIQPVFQDPYGSLNPRRSIASIVSLPLEVHGIGNALERRRKAIEMLERVSLRPQLADRYPRELSGGQRQRVAHCPGADNAARNSNMRRADFGAGCIGAIANSQSAYGFASRVQADLRVY